MKLVRLSGNAADLVGRGGIPMYLRLDGDPDNPNLWHPIATVHDVMVEGVYALTIDFHDETPEKVFNEQDSVEFALVDPRD